MKSQETATYYRRRAEAAERRIAELEAIITRLTQAGDPSAMFREMARLRDERDLYRGAREAAEREIERLRAADENREAAYQAEIIARAKSEQEATDLRAAVEAITDRQLFFCESSTGWLWRPAPLLVWHGPFSTPTDAALAWVKEQREKGGGV